MTQPEYYYYTQIRIVQRMRLHSCIKCKQVQSKLHSYLRISFLLVHSECNMRANIKWKHSVEFMHPHILSKQTSHHIHSYGRFPLLLYLRYIRFSTKCHWLSYEYHVWTWVARDQTENQNPNKYALIACRTILITSMYMYAICVVRVVLSQRLCRR